MKYVRAVSDENNERSSVPCIGSRRFDVASNNLNIETHKEQSMRVCLSHLLHEAVNKNRSDFLNNTEILSKLHVLVNSSVEEFTQRMTMNQFWSERLSHDVDASRVPRSTDADSPLTCENVSLTDVRRNVEVIQQELFTTHIREDGTIEISHGNLDNSSLSNVTMISKYKHPLDVNTTICAGQGKKFFSCGKSLVRFDFGDRTWKRCKDMPFACYRHSMAIVGQTMYSLGGVNPKIAGAAMPLIQTCNIHNDSWSTKGGKLIVPMWSMAAARYRNQIMMFGGADYTHESTTYVQCYDPLTKTTECWNELPFPVVNANAVISGDLAYIVPLRGPVIRYDLVNRNSSVFHRTRNDDSLVTAVFVFAHRLHVVRSIKDGSQLVEAFNDCTNSWTTVGRYTNHATVRCCAVS